MTKLLLDDEEINLHYKTFHHFDGQEEYNKGWTQVFNYIQFCKFIEENGVPDVVSFDSNLHDFNGDGYSCAKFLKDKCIELSAEFPLWICHSNMPSRQLIDLLNEFKPRKVKDFTQIKGI